MHGIPILINIIFILLFYSASINSTRAFINFLRHKPAIILTPQYYQVNFLNIKIEWGNIKTVGICFFRGPFLSFLVNTPSKIYKQFNDPGNRINLFFNSKLVKGDYFTAIGLVKAQKDNILDAVQEYHNKYINQ